MAITVLGLAGGAGVGKDYVANELRRYGFSPFGLADDAKVILVGQGVMTYEEAFELPKNDRNRTALVYLIEGARYVHGMDVWIRTAKASMRRMESRFGVNRFVITDCRRPMEADAVRELGGKVIGIRAPIRWAQNGMSEQMRAASTEMFGREFEQHVNGFDAVLNNDIGDEVTVPRQLEDILAGFGISGTLVNARVRIGTNLPDATAKTAKTATVMDTGLKPLCLTCGPKHIMWMGPVVQTCAECRQRSAWR